MTTLTTLSSAVPPHHAGTGRIARMFLAAALAWVLSLSLLPGATFAGERSSAGQATLSKSVPALPVDDLQSDPMGGLSTKIENLAKSVSKIATPVAILAIVVALIMFLFAPFLPDIAQQNKGFVMRALVIVAIIGFVPELVKAFANFSAS